MAKFDVFLCHHGPDKPAVRRFADALRARGLEPWLDVEQLQPGLPWQRELERQIQDIGAAAVFVGASGIGPWQREEIDGYLRRFQELQCPVIPVLLPDAGEAPELPLFLGARTWVDFRGKSADDREVMDRLAWGITGENPSGTAPVPHYTDDTTRAESEELETLYEQLEAQRQNGEDPGRTQTRILELRRKMRDRQLKAGEFLGDRYKLLERLGQGGFAEVWKAYDRTERATVALKVLHGQYAHNRSRRERFLRGARKMRSLDHPAIVRVLGDIPRIEDLKGDEDVFFAMEYLPGGDLHHAVLEKRISTKDALSCILEIGHALSRAHTRKDKLIHRDVKPANILLTGDGRAKLTDFDLVRAGDTTGGTRTQGMGSFVYAAPEMMRDAKKADARADVFGLAMTAVFVLHGGTLPDDALFETETFLRGLELEPGLRDLLERALRRKPAERTASVERFCDELRAALEPPTVLEPDPSEPPSPTTVKPLPAEPSTPEPRSAIPEPAPVNPKPDPEDIPIGPRLARREPPPNPPLAKAARPKSAIP